MRHWKSERQTTECKEKGRGGHRGSGEERPLLRRPWPRAGWRTSMRRTQPAAHPGAANASWIHESFMNRCGLHRGHRCDAPTAPRQADRGHFTTAASDTMVSSGNFPPKALRPRPPQPASSFAEEDSKQACRQCSPEESGEDWPWVGGREQRRRVGCCHQSTFMHHHSPHSAPCTTTAPTQRRFEARTTNSREPARGGTWLRSGGHLQAARQRGGRARARAAPPHPLGSR